MYARVFEWGLFAALFKYRALLPTGTAQTSRDGETLSDEIYAQCGFYYYNGKLLNLNKIFLLKADKPPI